MLPAHISESVYTTNVSTAMLRWSAHSIGCAQVGAAERQPADAGDGPIEPPHLVEGHDVDALEAAHERSRAADDPQRIDLLR
jgi:hypothetical protein